MLSVSTTHLADLNPLFISTKLILIGELHGSAQNAPLIQELLIILLEHVEQVTIAFEWSLTPAEHTALRAYVRGGPVPTPLPTFFADSDGRFTPEHAELLSWIHRTNRARENRVDLYCFDNAKSDQNAEQELATSLISYRHTQPDATILVETGNFHARKEPTSTRPSLATLLATYEPVSTIFIRYLSGKIMVEGRARNVTDAASQRDDVSKAFDAVIEIPRSDPAPDPVNLTTIKILLEQN